jgi:2-polyprenyl-3-methyl-5-hydroxy-6-metoxy-1,4-benzoquinol methylase
LLNPIGGSTAMDDTTLHAYAIHAGEIARRHAASSGRVSRYFDRAFSPGDRILDVGAGAGRAREATAQLGVGFDGLVCSAVLQHLAPAALADAVTSLRAALRPKGRALVSVPSRRDDLDADGRDALGRLFNGATPDELCALFAKTGFRELQQWDAPDSLGRKEVRWAVLLFERSAGLAEGPGSDS